MKRIYINYRNSVYNMGQWFYTPSYTLNQVFSDYEWLITINDNIIPDDRYNKINPNWKLNLTKFGYYEYVDWMDELALIESIKLIASYNAITIIPTKEEAILDIKSRTNLIEKSPWIFILNEESIWISWEIIPEQILEII